ncbi:MAG TPA: hypothetical protein DHN33_00780 [Eubacteriaceae bacterium]|nr:hypothetical protein [Eubacteriaceae bacterium]
MSQLIGIVFLLCFIGGIAGLFLKVFIETNERIKRSFEKSGFKGNYREYKKIWKRKNKNRRKR